MKGNIKGKVKSIPYSTRTKQKTTLWDDLRTLAKKGSRSMQKSMASRALDERKFLLSSRSDFYIREAYKILRTNVSFALTGEEQSKVIVVTSSLQSEGKSITAVNLAISYAMTDRKVLIVDCDMRRPKLARLLGMNSKVGLSNLLMKPDLKEEAILHTGTPGLDVLLSGDIPPNPSELLSSPRMQRLIQELREDYDFILLDSPPINMVTDAVVLAPQSDGVLFLVRANLSERGAVIHAVEQLEYAKAKILGFVLNGVEMEDSHYGYGKYRYKKYSRYGRYGYGYGRYGYGYSRGYGYGYSSTRVAPVPEAEESAAEEQAQDNA